VIDTLKIIMPDQPLVTIAAINYNNSMYILETLNSIRDQTYTNIELIIVDDCSIDNSVELVENWLKTYTGKYKFIKHEVNKGVCVACNTGLRNATGEYVSSIATDDAMMPDKTKIQVAILEASGEDVAGLYSDAYLMDEHSNPINGVFIDIHRKFNERPSGNIYEVLLQGNYIPAMTFLFKRKLFDDIGLYDESLVYEDYDMWLRIARKYTILFSDFISCKYRIRPGSLSSTIKNWDYSDIKIFSKHAGAPLPMQRLRNIAHKVYVNSDQQTIALLPKLAADISDEYIAAAYLLSQCHVPVETGETILSKIKTEEKRTATNITALYAKVFSEYIRPEVSDDQLKGMLWKWYSGGDSDSLQIIKDLAISSGDLYYKTIYLLSELCIPIDMCSLALSSLDKEHANSLPPVEDGVRYRFLHEVFSAIPLAIVKKIAANAFYNGNTRFMPIIEAWEKKTKDRYFKAILLLRKYRVNVPTAQIILERIDGYCNARVNNTYIDICIYKDIFGAIRNKNTSLFK
jgi:glycosyltransferase involved in cell wall biosynthesis